jgi:hypothetical protein
MSQSYIPQGTKVICTNMTNNSPQTLVAIRGKKTVIHPKGILLTKEDLKISDTFVCKNTSKFWGGLTTMCAGIAIGALAVLVVAAATAAEVASGGLATPVIIALVGFGAASAATVGSAITLAVKSHDCDYTMESEWLHFHTKVHFDEANAILHNSLLKCNKGGMVSIFLDDTVAQEAAADISKNNSEEVSEHENSQFFEGLITGVTSLTGVGVCIGLTFSVWDYTGDENEMEKGQGEYAEKRYEDEEKRQELESESLGESEIKRTEKFGYREVPAGPAADLGMALKNEGKEGAENYIKEASFKWEKSDEFFGKGWKGSVTALGIGFAGAVASTWIDNSSNRHENDQFNKAMNNAIKSSLKDEESTGISVIATQS